MAALRVRRFIVALSALALLAIPGNAAAQSSTFIEEFIRVGTPGTKTVETIDPLTLEPTTIVVDTGAFVNPCTSEFVDVRGSSTISTLQTIDKFGTVKVNVSVVTKGTGSGWVASPTGPLFTTSSYAFSDSQQFSFRLPVAGEEFSSDFSDKLALKGAKSIDNWIIRAHFRIKVNADGTTQVLLIKMNADACKG
jgi:hypothetical protein